MDILILNPNTSTVFTKSIQVAADHLKGPNTQVEAINPSSGPNTMDCMYDTLLSAQPSLEVLIRRQDQFDGIIVACFSNHPVIAAGREITTKPVIGIMEASLYLACMLGKYFSIVTPPDRCKANAWDAVRAYGLASKCASVRTLGLAVADFESPDEQTVRSQILNAASKAVKDDGAEVIVLGCGGMAGLDRELQTKLSVPVVEGVAAALKIMEGLLSYGITTSKIRSYAQPDRKQLVGMPDVFNIPYSIE